MRIVNKSKSAGAPLTGSIQPMASSKATFINFIIDEFRGLMARRKPRKIIITSGNVYVRLRDGDVINNK